MNRRDLLKMMAGAAGVSAAFPDPIRAATAEMTCAADVAATPDPWKTAFRDALAERPWLIGYEGTDKDRIPLRRAALQGRLPSRLEGTLFRNGPARHEIGEFRYRHWFDGDGMVQAWRIGDGKVDHHARMVRTSKYDAERAAGRALYPAFGTAVHSTCAVRNPDAINAANISVLPLPGELWALWEAGSPWRLDPDSLDTLGVQTFSPETRGAPFSAHPRVDADGTIWNFGYASFAGMLVLWQLDPSGSLKQATAFSVEPMTMPHDFVVTKRHLVLLLPPLDFDPNSDGSLSFLDRHVWKPSRPTRVLVVDKNDLSSRVWLEMPAEWAFHFGNAWEDEAGVIRFDGARYSGPDLMYGSLRGVMKGELRNPDERLARHVLYRIDTRERVASQELLGPTEFATDFPAVDPRRSALQHQWVTVLGVDEQGDSIPSVHGGLDTVVRLNTDTGDVRKYRYPETLIPEEHVFAPDPAGTGEHQGWLIGTALNWRERSTVLNIFDANEIEAGPIATATIPEPMPLGLHGRFSPRLADAL